MTCKEISSVVTSLRSLQVDFNELTSEINDLWRQLLASQRIKCENRERMVTKILFNLTDSIEQIEIPQSILSAHVSILKAALRFSESMKLSATFKSDLEYLLEHLNGIRDEREKRLVQLSDCLDFGEIEEALKERNLFEENYQLSVILRRIKVDLTLAS
ncbi:hypothetical protein M3Y97_00504800 [Aphelenchoides bicaudatus]|nr:hypothetical protein M3Y97_00504800 [Aphelenchoides bicaudatus]